jgi:hypothetical protein
MPQALLRQRLHGLHYTPQDDFILQQSDQQEQQKHMFFLVSSLGSKIEAVAVVEAKSSSSSRRVDPPESGPSHEEKGKSATRSVSFAKEVDEKDGEIDDDENRGIDSDDDYVSHRLYRDIIGEGFDKRSPSRLPSNKPTYFFRSSRRCSPTTPGTRSREPVLRQAKTI